MCNAEWSGLNVGSKKLYIKYIKCLGFYMDKYGTEQSSQHGQNNVPEFKYNSLGGKP